MRRKILLTSKLKISFHSCPAVEEKSSKLTAAHWLIPMGCSKVHFKPRPMLMPNAIRRDATGNLTNKLLASSISRLKSTSDNILAFRAFPMYFLCCLATIQENKYIEIFISGWEQVTTEEQLLGTGFMCLCDCLLTQTPQNQLRCSPHWGRGQVRGCWNLRTGVGVCWGNGESAAECCHAETNTGSYVVHNTLQGTTYTHTQNTDRNHNDVRYSLDR